MHMEQGESPNTEEVIPETERSIGLTAGFFRTGERGGSRESPDSHAFLRVAADTMPVEVEKARLRRD